MNLSVLGAKNAEAVKLFDSPVGSNVPPAWLHHSQQCAASTAPAGWEFRFRLNGWTLAAVLLSLFLFLPMAEVLWHLTSPAENWEHLRDTVLGRYLKGSAILVIGTAGLSLLLGVSTAWLVACCEFPGRRFFEWALILPLAIPTYIAFAYFDLIDRLTPLLIWCAPTSARRR